jgi:hypothetical protein
MAGNHDSKPNPCARGLSLSKMISESTLRTVLFLAAASSFTATCASAQALRTDQYDYEYTSHYFRQGGEEIMRVKTVTRTRANVFKLLVIPGPCATRRVGPAVVVEVFDAPVGAIRKGDVLIYGVVDASKAKVGDRSKSATSLGGSFQITRAAIEAYATDNEPRIDSRVIAKAFIWLSIDAVRTSRNRFATAR